GSALALALASLACQPNTAPTPGTLPDSADDDPVSNSIVVRTVPESIDTLVFPPPAAGRGQRPALTLPDGSETAKPDKPEEPFGVRYPRAGDDADATFNVYGQTFHVTFNRPVALPKKIRRNKPVPANEGTLTIEPAVEGSARWTSEYVLEFTAKKPFDPDTTYTVTVNGVESAPRPADGKQNANADNRAAEPAEDASAPEPELLPGEAMKEPWTAKFNAEPRIPMAGKVLSYIPKPGSPRVVIMRPHSGSKVGGGAELGVVFDQPVGLKQAEELVKLRKDDNTFVDVTLSHPSGSTFQGVKINKRHVVIAKPTEPLTAGEDYELVAWDAERQLFEQRESTVHDFTVAPELERTGVRCGYGYNNTCDWSEPKLTMSGRDIEVEFNNRISMSEAALKNAVRVSPPVPNLRVWSSGYWDSSGSVRISGGFNSSSTYTITINGLRDAYGHTQSEPVRFNVVTLPETASASMPEGSLVLDEQSTRAFTVTTRNVVRASLEVWPVTPGDPTDLKKAREHADRHTKPAEEPKLRIPFMPAVKRDEFVKTEVDLLSHLTPGSNYLVALNIDGTGFGAKETEYPSWSRAGRTPVALLTPGDGQTLAVHTHSVPDATIVQVARMSTGEPVPGASFTLNGESITGAPVSDANGVAVLPFGIDRLNNSVLDVKGGGTTATISPSSRSTRGRSLFPSMGAGEVISTGDRRGLIMTDRGIYRPGATIHIKAMARKKIGERYVPIPSTPVEVKVFGPMDDELESFKGVTNDMGSFAVDYESTLEGRVGRHRVTFELLDEAGELGETFVQVSEFEPPRFTVDVDAGAKGSSAMRATVVGKYLFGAPMDGADVEWSLTREPASLPSGRLSDAGLVFSDDRSDWWDDDVDDERWSRSGRGKLGADGTLTVEQKVDVGNSGPQAFTLEADVADASYRHIAGRGRVVIHPSKYYAGLKLASSWSPVSNPLSVGLGVADQEGEPVAGVQVSARLQRVKWRYTKQRDGGGVRYEWHATRTQVDSCTVTSERDPVTCELTPPDTGDYEIISSVNGRDGGARSTWVWGRGSTRALFPTKGRTVDITTDKPRYKPGEVAKLMVRNPYPGATAILTLEQGGLITHQSLRIDDEAAFLDVPIKSAYAPHVHATVTLLPRGAEDDDRVDWKVGAVRIPVSMDDARLALDVKTDKEAYEPGETVTIDLSLRDHGSGVGGGEIALAVVDEGVLRMTNHHAPDPVTKMRPGQPLNFEAEDTREALAAFLRLNKATGDGDAGEGNVESARKKFVKTALWRPDIRTDKNGKARVQFTLPDNLTRFRVMAVALDREGKGASSEHGFYVRKPIMMIPVVPRFASVGDQIEAAAMLHNNAETPLEARVTLGREERRITLAPESRQRVNFPMTTDTVGPLELDFSVRDGSDAVRDRVVVNIPVQRAGVLEHPRLDAAFVGEQLVKLKVPAGVVPGKGGQEAVVVRVGQHLWPELGARLSYLLDYPHGCVEQTTSSTLPLLAARDILPRIGYTGMSQAELDKRIKSGIERLQSMKTPSGGLAYWPGGTSPNVYGTAYAIRAVIAAKQAGIELPKGLLEGMQEYLDDEVTESGREPEVRAAIAQSLAELDELPQSAADSLYDTREQQGVFGLASLAIALNALDGQEDRVKQLLDDLEGKFDAEGKLLDQPGYGDFYYYGSPVRSKAQALIAIGRLRKSAKLRPVLFQRLSEQLGGYTTQSTAYSLMAMAEQLVDNPADGATFTVTLDGAALTPSREIGSGSFEYAIPIAQLAGNEANLVLRSDSKAAIAFMVDAVWTRDLKDAASWQATSARLGPNVYRLYTDPKGGPVDLANVSPGQMVRVALLAELPDELERERMSYLAITDRLPAGFEPVQTDLWTVARAPELTDEHPFARWLRWGSNDASYIELRDDRVHVYFDRVWGERALATYLVRASTPGRFALPPAMGEFMYVADSQSYSEGGEVVVKQ
ncbi:MAG: hypothetical protein KC468_09120, partial [Myxococcales bacterium]|nr:hypothetical protein [Myxococcales bacterium]